MQSSETGRSLAHIDRDLIELRCKELFDCYQRMDVEGALTLFVDDATVVFPRRSLTRADSGTHVGKDEIRRVFRKLDVEYEVIWQELREVLVNADKASVYRVIHARFRGTGTACTLISSDWFTFRDGLISRLECITRIVQG